MVIRYPLPVLTNHGYRSDPKRQVLAVGETSVTLVEVTSFTLATGMDLQWNQKDHSLLVHSTFIIGIFPPMVSRIHVDDYFPHAYKVKFIVISVCQKDSEDTIQ